MSFIGRTLAQTTLIPFTPLTYDEVYRDRLGAVAMPIDRDSAMAIPAVYACTTVVSEDIAKVPLQMFERIPDGKDLVPNHPLYELLHDQPNQYQTAIEFREMMTAFALNSEIGGVAKIVSGPRGPVDQLKPLHPDLLSREVTDKGVLRYRYQNPATHTEEVYLPDELFIIRGRFGRSVLGYARESLALQLAMQRFASQMYRRGPRHTGVIARPKDAPKWSDTARTNFRTAVDEYMGEGERAGRPMLLEDGMTWQSAGISMHDAEFLATMQHGVADVCRWYRVPQHKIQELLRSTNNNIEQQSIDYVVDSLVAWAVRWEQAIRRDLILNPARFFAEHNLDGLLRGDSKTRAEANALAVQWGWLLPSEVRIRENLNPIPGIDERALPSGQGGGQLGSGQGGGLAGPSSPAVVSYLRLLVRDAAARVVRKEVATLGKLAESGRDWESGVRSFYVEHAEFVARILRVPDDVAEDYAAGRCVRLIEAGPVALDDFDTSTVADLTETALERSDVLRLEPQAAPRVAVTVQQPPQLAVVAQRWAYNADGLLIESA